MEIPKELKRKARSRAILSMKFASDSPKLSYAELTLIYRKGTSIKSKNNRML
ncbi:hypothetical protein LEP1GSC016_0490 [Leptospira borgpetersenii serovar Hardjo-bovis str. Sponselee]|uniref:Uncharacterized protein n=1 Tax=Leptospira borgpetersenii serovar Hardjo-bovis str. Sponselee TaxID=1303729 RepID=M6C548_LEPBO|nr:hypothetical protein LEP1GSC016_0490 [Leptospira borgpetersenii serovar Hardjo-bovis str. Sponselee]